jgi:hypothetical protein
MANSLKIDAMAICCIESINQENLEWVYDGLLLTFQRHMRTTARNTSIKPIELVRTCVIVYSRALPVNFLHDKAYFILSVTETIDHKSQEYNKIDDYIIKQD